MPSSGRNVDPRLPEGWELVVALLDAARAIIDDAHAALAEQGHPDTRPAHAYVMQLVASGTATVTDLAARLGVTSQAVGQMVDEMATRGYLVRTVDPADRRRRQLVLGPAGVDFLERSAHEFARICHEWTGTIGPERLARLYADLVTLGGLHGRPDTFRPLW
jgi:DNA-binding MarR family transcriptional regulator